MSTESTLVGDQRLDGAFVDNKVSPDRWGKLLLFTISATLVLFFGFLKLYAGQSIMVWAWRHWAPDMNQEYCRLVIPISILLAWYHRGRLRAAPKRGSNWGLAVVGAGFFLVL